MSARIVQLMLLHVDWIRTSDVLFHYRGFAWLPRPPGWGIYAVLGLALVGAIGMAHGRYYPRVSAALACGAFSYFFLLDKANFGNLNYLLCWLSFMMIWLPAYAQRDERVGRWAVWTPRALIALLYFFAGVIKLRADWLSGAVIEIFATDAQMGELARGLFTIPAVSMALAWGGALFDLLIGPMLLWPRTRKLALVLMSTFHLTNVFLVGINDVPVAMLTLTLLAFIDPNVARRVRTRGEEREALTPAPGEPLPVWAQWALALLLVFHVAMPLRPYVYPGDGRWTGEGQHFSWWLRSFHMDVSAKFYVQLDGGSRQRVDPLEHIGRAQSLMATDPYMIVQFAHFLEEEYQRRGHEEVAVWGDITASLNSRPWQRYIREDLDLSQVPLTSDMTDIVVPLGEQLVAPEEEESDE